MKIKIRLAKEGDLKAYTKLLQKTYEDAYVNNSLGLTRDCLSEAVFNSDHSQGYFKQNLQVTRKSKTWLVFLEDELVGSITIFDKGNECEMRGFYVATKYQGKGIGKRLWELVLDFAKGKDIVLSTYAHNTKTIAIYKKWGFEEDKERGEFYRHWPEWPENLRIKSIYMRYKSC
jgi:ribosomal protein S18 acetylase RimI-like enzyme